MSLLDALLLTAAAVLALPAATYCIECVVAAVCPARSAQTDDPAPPKTTLLVPAHDEAAMISETVRGLTAAVDQGLPGRGEVLVVADNCSDSTAQLAEEAGASVTVRNDPERRGKGFAIEHGMRALEGSPPDVVVIVDADCRLKARDLRTLTSRAHALRAPVQAQYVIDAPHQDSPLANISAFAVRVKNCVRPRGLEAMGLPCQLTGSGMAFPYEVLRNAPPTGSNIVEDMVMGIGIALQGTPPRALSRATVSSVLPSGTEAATGQRRRWEHGHLSTALRHSPRLLLAAARRLSPSLLAMGLDLLVPPLALLTSISIACVGACAVSALNGGDHLALAVSAAGLLMVALGTISAWLRYGRDVLPLRHLLLAPGYVAWKIPLYIAFFARKSQQTWNRTARDDET